MHCLSFRAFSGFEYRPRAPTTGVKMCINAVATAAHHRFFLVVENHHSIVLLFTVHVYTLISIDPSPLVIAVREIVIHTRRSEQRGLSS